METIIINSLIVLAAFCSMEAVAWFTHKFIMHGLLWIWHKDHHKKETSGFFEHNDFFFLVFALPGIAGLFFGMKNDYNFLFWIGLGITLYGLCYFHYTIVIYVLTFDKLLPLLWPADRVF